MNVLAEQGKFRPDLYYRLNVASLTLPALRNRREDIPLLFEFFVLQAALRYGQPAALVSGELIASLMAQRWAGNVRELPRGRPLRVWLLYDTRARAAASVSGLASRTFGFHHRGSLLRHNGYVSMRRPA